MNKNRESDSDAPADGPEDALSDAPLGGGADDAGASADSDDAGAVPAAFSAGGGVVPGMEHSDADAAPGDAAGLTEQLDESANASGDTTGVGFDAAESEAGADSFDGAEEGFVSLDEFDGDDGGLDDGADADSDT